MPADPSMIEMPISIFVSRERAEEMRQILEDESDECFLLNVERLAGMHLSGDRGNLQQVRVYGNASTEHYGQGVLEVYRTEET